MCKVRIPGEVISVGILLKKSQSPIIDCFTILYNQCSNYGIIKESF